VTRHKGALHHAHYHWRRFVHPRASGFCGFHSHSFRGFLGPCQLRAAITWPARTSYIPEKVRLHSRRPLTLVPQTSYTSNSRRIEEDLKYLHDTVAQSEDERLIWEWISCSPYGRVPSYVHCVASMLLALPPVWNSAAGISTVVTKLVVRR
jgi:hypothetical protein